MRSKIKIKSVMSLDMACFRVCSEKAELDQFSKILILNACTIIRFDSISLRFSLADLNNLKACIETNSITKRLIMKKQDYLNQQPCRSPSLELSNR